MAWYELREKEVVCRKPHQCEWCGTRIEKGEKAHSRTTRNDDGIGTYHAHLDCWVAICKSSIAMLREGKYEWIPGDFKRGEVYGDER